jgi:hypothetical protein
LHRWGEHHHDLFEGSALFYKPSYVGNLVSSWITSLEGIEEKLKQGAKVADIGCGYTTFFDCLHDLADPVGATKFAK